jgi:hypothetical protein
MERVHLVAQRRLAPNQFFCRIYKETWEAIGEAVVEYDPKTQSDAWACPLLGQHVELEPLEAPVRWRLSQWLATVDDPDFVSRVLLKDVPLDQWPATLGQLRRVLSGSAVVCKSAAHPKDKLPWHGTLQELVTQPTDLWQGLPGVVPHWPALPAIAAAVDYDLGMLKELDSVPGGWTLLTQGLAMRKEPFFVFRESAWKPLVQHLWSSSTRARAWATALSKLLAPLVVECLTHLFVNLAYERRGTLAPGQIVVRLDHHGALETLGLLHSLSVRADATWLSSYAQTIRHRQTVCRFVDGTLRIGFGHPPGNGIAKPKDGDRLQEDAPPDLPWSQRLGRLGTDLGADARALLTRLGEPRVHQLTLLAALFDVLGEGPPVPGGTDVPSMWLESHPLDGVVIDVGRGGAFRLRTYGDQPLLPRHWRHVYLHRAHHLLRRSWFAAVMERMVIDGQEEIRTWEVSWCPAVAMSLAGTSVHGLNSIRLGYLFGGSVADEPAMPTEEVGLLRSLLERLAEQGRIVSAPVPAPHPPPPMLFNTKGQRVLSTHEADEWTPKRIAMVRAGGWQPAAVSMIDVRSCGSLVVRMPHLGPLERMSRHQLYTFVYQFRILGAPMVLQLSPKTKPTFFAHKVADVLRDPQTAPTDDWDFD